MPGEIKAIIGKLEGSRRPLILTAIFTGLRASELRGLRWEDVDLKRGELHVRQRADQPRDNSQSEIAPGASLVLPLLRWPGCPNGESCKRPIKYGDFIGAG
jgi:integrase